MQHLKWNINSLTAFDHLLFSGLKRDKKKKRNPQRDTNWHTPTNKHHAHTTKYTSNSFPDSLNINFLI
jgi:hypothetical protein